MTIDAPRPEQLPGLKVLWKQAFGDEDPVIDHFFSTAFAQERCLCVLDEEKPVACAYWLPASLDGHRFAYIYAVATEEGYRGQGLCHRLMAQVHGVLARDGYAGAVLKPAGQDLFAFYGSMGYRPCCKVREFTCQAGLQSTELRLVDGNTYARLRETRLPHGGLVQGAETLANLAGYCRFLVGDDLLLCGWVDGDTLLVQEFLGDADAAPGVTAALGAKEGCFRMAGEEHWLAMYLPLTDDCPEPGYLGLPMD